jgi:hypothetical protein
MVGEAGLEPANSASPRDVMPGPLGEHAREKGFSGFHLSKIIFRVPA